ncbi:Hemin transport system permease protein HmuU [Planctomycetes bacterium Pan216]|uniref:Hemin transport system permease protein HmuU n=1 Tax=Kolteria novifilia TaxID=2527975 RepID=A0A518B0D4_9BACT|nr:Hemin transport system permease protein HmuU [Planctomycetes bacterium Pan216]
MSDTLQRDDTIATPIAITGLSPSDSYRRHSRRRLLFLVAAIGVVLVSLMVDLITGPASLSIAEVFHTLLSPWGGSGREHVIVWMLRMPTALLALLVGAALGVAGAEMQTILNNPLASPYTLGVSSGACFGAALALVFGTGASLVGSTVLVPLAAFGFAMLSSATVYGIARVKGGSTESIVLGGVALHFLFSAGVAFLKFVSSEDQLAAIVFWIFGSLQGATWPKLMLVSACLLVTLPVLALDAWKLTALRLGDDRANSLGLDVRTLRRRILLIVSLLTATAVCFVGAVGFVGLVAPHIARMSVGEDQRYFLPLSAILGALLLSCASIVSKCIIPGTVFPLGVATAFIGVPFFISLILGGRSRFW